jgi:fructose-1,6-bisphosphatase/inositol monophosphatase family enzyme
MSDGCFSMRPRPNVGESVSVAAGGSGVVAGGVTVVGAVSGPHSGDLVTVKLGEVVVIVTNRHSVRTAGTIASTTAASSCRLCLCHDRTIGGWLLLTREAIVAPGGEVGARGSASCAPA